MSNGVLLALGIMSGLTAALPDPEIVWECRVGGNLLGTPVFFPFVDQPDGVLTWIDDGRLVFVDAQGRLVWEKDMGEAGQASPAIGDLDQDGSPEIVTATYSGVVVALDADGGEIWRYPLGADVKDWGSCSLVDLDGDGNLDVLVGDMDGWMTCLSHDGRLKWRFKADEQKASSPAYAPVGTARGPLVVYGTENDHIVAVRPSGELAWLSRHEGQYGRTNPTVGDITGDGRYEVILHTSYNNPNSRLLTLDASNGDLVWEARVNLHGYVGNAIADVDGDGVNEALVALRSNTIYCFDGNGLERWRAVTGGHAYFFAPAIADINGDGRCEIIAGVRDSNERGKSWFVLSDRGEILGEYEMPGGANGTPLAADIDRDGRIDIVLPGSKAGLLRCVTFGGKAEGARLPWVSSRYDAARTGCVPATRPQAVQGYSETDRSDALDADWCAAPTWGRNALRIAQWPDTGGRAVVEAAVVDAFGRRTTRVWDVEPDERPETLPVDLIGQGVHKVTARVYRPGRWDSCAAQFEERVKLGPFRTFARRVRSDLGRLDEVADGLPFEASHTARLLKEHRAQRNSALDALEKEAARLDLSRMPNVDLLSRRIESFHADMEDDLALARLARAMAESHPGVPVAAWQDPNPWDDVPPLLDAVVPSAEVPIHVSLYQGEYESCAVVMLNLHYEPVVAQVRPVEAARVSLIFYEVIDTPRPDGTWVPDALAELSSAQTISIAPGAARRLWITVNGKVLEAGTSDLSVELLPLGADDQRVRVAVHADVEDLDLRKAPLFRVCNWSSPGRLLSDGIDPAGIIVAREHGMNVFVVGMPHRKCDAAGVLIGKADWSKLDAELELMGEDGFVLLSSGAGVSIPEGVETYGEVHVKAQRAWLRELADHLASKRWSKDRWALYPVDEPGLFGGTRIRMFEEIASHFKKAMPDAPIYANPSGFVTPENMAGMVPLTDVWQPEQALLRRQPELAPFFLGTGKPVWCYEAPGDVKTLRPLGYYRANSWMAFRLGLHGTGFWTQIYVGPKPEDNDLWLKRAATEYGANYAVAGREVISRRWEAFRDGIEDVRAFMLLRDAAEDARAAGRSPEWVARAEKLLGAEVEHATRKALACGDITRFLRDYEMDYAEIGRIRKEAAEITRALLAQ